MTCSEVIVLDLLRDRKLVQRTRSRYIALQLSPRAYLNATYYDDNPILRTTWETLQGDPITHRPDLHRLNAQFIQACHRFFYSPETTTADTEHETFPTGTSGAFAVPRECGVGLRMDDFVL